jgi:hypothetical protein
VEDSKSPFPSRLGFFHATDTNFSYLDTSRLCVNCCADVVPGGYGAWSTFGSILAGGKAQNPQAGKSDSATPARRWLDITASREFYPLAFQAGTEGFKDGPTRKRSRFAKDTPIVIAKIIAADPVKIPVPRVTGAKEAWLWLEAQGKPFYIDQLHLTKGWSPMAEKNAAIDSKVAAESGTTFDRTAIVITKPFSVQRKSTGEVPISVAQSVPRGLDSGPSVAHEVFELEAPLVSAPIPSPSPTIGREWASNRGRHAPIPLGSPAELPAYPAYMQRSQNQGHRPQSSLREFLVVQNFVPADSVEFGAAGPLERSYTMGSPGVSLGMGQRGALSRQISAPAGSVQYVQAASRRTISRGISVPVLEAQSFHGFGQASAGMAEVSSSPKLKKGRAAKRLVPDIQESGRGTEFLGLLPEATKKLKKTKAKGTTKAVSKSIGGAGGSKSTPPIPKVKTKRSPALDALLRKREVEDTATVTQKAPKKSKAKGVKSREAHDLSLQSPAGLQFAKPAKKSTAPAHLQARGPTALPRGPKAPKAPKVCQAKPRTCILNSICDSLTSEIGPQRASCHNTSRLKCTPHPSAP